MCQFINNSSLVSIIFYLIWFFANTASHGAFLGLKLVIVGRRTIFDRCRGVWELSIPRVSESKQSLSFAPARPSQTWFQSLFSVSFWGCWACLQALVRRYILFLKCPWVHRCSTASRSLSTIKIFLKSWSERSVMWRNLKEHEHHDSYLILPTC